MSVRFTDLTRPGHTRTRKRLGLALQLGGLICSALGVLSGHLDRDAGPLFILWVFLGHLIQSAAVDRERLEAIAGKMALLTELGLAPDRGANGTGSADNNDREPDPLFSGAGGQPVHGNYSARPILLTAGYWKEGAPTGAASADGDGPPGHSG